RHRRLRDADRVLRKRGERGPASAQGMRRGEKDGVERRREKEAWKGIVRASLRVSFSRLLFTPLFHAFLFYASLAAQRPQPFNQQLRDNQRRLEDIRRERTEVEQELERLKTQ